MSIVPAVAAAADGHKCHESERTKLAGKVTVQACRVSCRVSCRDSGQCLSPVPGTATYFPAGDSRECQSTGNSLACSSEQTALGAHCEQRRCDLQT
jgi:hypothetical protein